MKIFKFLLAASLFVVLLSCNTDNETQSENFQESSLTLDIDQIDALLVSNLEGQKNAITLKTSKNNDNSNTERKYTELWLKGKNLNSFVKGKNQSLDILSLTIYSSETSESKGLAMHYYSKSQNSIFIDVYDIDKGILVKKEGFPMRVNDIIFEDLTYLGNKYYSSENINLVSATDFSIEGVETNYNDLYIGYITDTFKTHKKNIISLAQSGRLDNISKSTDTAFISDFIDGGDGFGKGCALNHRCQNGDGSMTCGNYGCVSICPRSEVNFYAGSNSGLSSYQNTINNYLPFSNLYALRDRLNSTLMGREYVNLYYAMGGHFANSIDASMIIDIAQMSPEIAFAIQNYMSGNNQETLISVSLANKINNLLQKSQLNSNSFTYKNSIDLVVQEVESFENLSLRQAQQQLSTGVVSIQ